MAEGIELDRFTLSYLHSIGALCKDNSTETELYKIISEEHLIAKPSDPEPIDYKLEE